jgi:parvulin-like peptidyl-prolyl isomerase
VILALGNEEVRRSEFERYVANVEARQGGALQASVRDALLSAYLEGRLQVLEARSRGWISAASGAEEEQAAVQRLLNEEVRSRIQVGDEEVARYYETHRAEFRVPERVTLRQILVSTPNEARDALRRLRKDPKSFEMLAQALSHGPEAQSGGLMGTFSRGELPQELEGAAFSLKAGETSQAIETSLGHHILRLDAIEPGRERGLEECRGHIRALLADQEAQRRERDFIAGLMARAKVNHEAAKARPSAS